MANEILFKAGVIKRPSTSIKSPYVADCSVNGNTVLVHTPGLGCCGLVEKERAIYVSCNGPNTKTAYTAKLAECVDEEGVYYVGIHPIVSQRAGEKILPFINSTAIWNKEVTVDAHSRLDFVGVTPGGKKIYVEVKTAMVSLQCNKPRCMRRAIFPEGYRKHKGEPVSPRAVKHAELLTSLCSEPNTESCVLLFLVPRNDCDGGLEINANDPIYHEAVRRAVLAGVIVRAFSLIYSINGTVNIGKELPVYIDLFP